MAFMELMVRLIGIAMITWRRTLTIRSAAMLSVNGNQLGMSVFGIGYGDGRMTLLDHYPKAYGAWAGNPAGSTPNHDNCCFEVSRAHGRWTSFGQCTRKRGFGPDGAFCKTHDPEAVKARQEASHVAWRDKHNKERYSWNGRSFYNVLKQIADGHNDARGLAQDTIKAFHDGEYK